MTSVALSGIPLESSASQGIRAFSCDLQGKSSVHILKRWEREITAKFQKKYLHMNNLDNSAWREQQLSLNLNSEHFLKPDSVLFRS